MTNTCLYTILHETPDITCGVYRRDRTSPGRVFLFSQSMGRFLKKKHMLSEDSNYLRM